MQLVSVILPAYNAEVFIGRTLTSILSQTYKNIEVLVVDDGSKDKTTEIVESFIQQDHRIFLFKQPNSGVASARNLAIQKSSGEYIAPIDADDIWHPQKIEKQVQCMLEDQNECVGMVYAWSVFIDEEDGIISGYNIQNNLDFNSLEGKVCPALVYTNFIVNGSTPLIRRICFEKLGGYTSKFREYNAQGCEDWDLYLRIAVHYEFRVVPDFLIGYRQGSATMSMIYKSMARSYDICMGDFKKKHPEIPAYIYDLSSSSFHLYLASKSTVCADHLTTLKFLYKAIILDYFLLGDRRNLLKIIKCILRFAFQPLTSLIWQDHQSWLEFRKKFGLPQNLASNQFSKIADIPIGNNNFQRKKYQNKDNIQWQRWLQVLELCEIVNHPKYYQ